MKPLTDEEFEDLKETANPIDGPMCREQRLIATVEALVIQNAKLRTSNNHVWTAVDENKELHEEIEKLKQEISELKSREFSNRQK